VPSTWAEWRTKLQCDKRSLFATLFQADRNLFVIGTSPEFEAKWD
jgi:hypothetical protein